MAEDVGLQRALWASLQNPSARPAPIPRQAPASRPSMSYGMRSSDIRPTVPSSRTPHTSSSQPSRTTTGRKNTLAREGFIPSRGDRARSPVKRTPGGVGASATHSADDDRHHSPIGRLSHPGGSRGGVGMSTPSPASAPLHREGPSTPRDGHRGAAPVSRRSSTVPGWVDYSKGGKLQRQNPTGGYLQLTCEEGWSGSGDFRRVPSSHCLLSTTALPGELAERAHCIQMVARVSMFSSNSLLFGVVLNFTCNEDDGGCTFIAATLQQAHSSKLQGQILRGHCRNGEFAFEELSHMAGLSVRTAQSLSIAVSRARNRVNLTVNGTKLFKNIDVGASPRSARFGLVAVGAKAQVRDIQCKEGLDDGATASSSTRDSHAGQGSGSHGMGGVRGPHGSGHGGSSHSGPSGGRQGNRDTDDSKYTSMIEQDILETNPNVQWEDIAALNEAKRLLNEAVVLPMIVPELFTGIRTPWQGVLLFGPPGTGKTLLAKAVATCANTTFFNMTASSLISKWHGESEKMIKALFQLARKHSPSTIFFDEIDALMMKRGDSNEHEASRRLKSELLSEMSGMNSSGDSRVMILATSNKPWDLDEAFRRRLEKRIYIPLPEYACGGLEARVELFKINMKDIPVAPDVCFSELAQRTEGYSGADIHQVCRDASMGPIRRLIAGKSPVDIAQMKAAGLLQATHPLAMSDFLESLSKISPSVNQKEIERYKAWERDFASV